MAQISEPQREYAHDLLAETEKLLGDGLLPLKVIADPVIYELEQEKLFPRTWCFLAHESEIPKPGDYVLRYIGGKDSVILVRSEDNEVKAYLNICIHRGARLVKADMGNTSHFRCTYHGFTYNTDGELIGMPVKEATYGNVPGIEDLGLYEVKLSSYKGMIFGNIERNAQPLSEFLGDARFYLDFMIDKTGEGMTFTSPQRWISHHNWKVSSDNFIQDNYHVMTSHVFMFDMGFLPKNPFVLAGSRVYCGNGHGIGTNRGITPEGPVDFPRPIGYPKWWPGVVEKARRHLPPNQFELWSSLTQMHGNIFPNLGLIETVNNYRDQAKFPPPFKRFSIFRPTSADTCEIWHWFAIENDAPDEYKKASSESCTESTGAAGLVEVDDMENWYNITQSSLTPSAKHIKLLYKIGSHEGLDKNWKYPGQASKSGFSEYPGIQFYKTWLKYLFD